MMMAMLVVFPHLLASIDRIKNADEVAAMGISFMNK